MMNARALFSPLSAYGLAASSLLLLSFDVFMPDMTTESGCAAFCTGMFYLFCLGRKPQLRHAATLRPTYVFVSLTLAAVFIVGALYSRLTLPKILEILLPIGAILFFLSNYRIVEKTASDER